MVFDLRPLQRGETKKLTIKYSLPLSAIEGITFDDGALVEGEVIDNAGYMRLHLNIKVNYVGECARCLSKVSGMYETEIERTVVAEGTLSEEKLEENVDEYIVVSKGQLVLDDLIDEEIMLSFPQKLLCKEDCLGLCPKCGKNLNEGKCSCVTKEIDPRLLVLKKLLDKQ